jgi:hypothetical protein
MNVGLGWARVSLLPSAPYSIRENSRSCVVGLAFERQRGVHAVGGDSLQLANRRDIIKKLLACYPCVGQHAAFFEPRSVRGRVS